MILVGYQSISMLVAYEYALKIKENYVYEQTIIFVSVVACVLQKN